MKPGKPFYDGKIHVLSEKCRTCIFRPGNLMDLSTGRVKQMVRDATRNESSITCHQTLSIEGAVCRGFFDAHKTQPLRMAERLGCIEYVEPPQYSNSRGAK